MDRPHVRLSTLLSGHLERCPACRKFVRDSDPECGHCGIRRTSFTVFRTTWTFGKYVVVPSGILIAILVYLAMNERQEEKRRIAIEHQNQR